MAVLRFGGVQVTDAGQRGIALIGKVNSRGYGDGSRGRAFNKLVNDGIAAYNYGPRGGQWGLWLTELGLSIFNHLYGWADAPVAVGDVLVESRANQRRVVDVINGLEVRVRDIATGYVYIHDKDTFLMFWNMGQYTLFVAPTAVSPVVVGDVLQMKGEGMTVAVSDVNETHILLRDGRTYSIAGFVLLTNMGGCQVVPRPVPRLTRIKSTSGTRRRNRG